MLFRSLPLGFVLFQLVTSKILGTKNYRKLTYFVISQKLILLITGLIFFKIFGINGVIIGMTISLFPYSIVIIKELKQNRINLKILKDKFHFITTSYVQTLIGALYSSLDKILILPLFGYAVLGEYALGLQFLTILMVIPEILRKYLLPNDSTGYKNIRLRFYAILFSAVISILGYFASPILVSLFFPKFELSMNIIQILSLNVFPNTIMYTYWTRFVAQERNRSTIIVSSCKTSTFVIGILLVSKDYGIIGITFVILIASIITALVSFFIYRITLKK